MVRKKNFVYSWDEVPVIIDPPYVAHLLGCSRENVRKMCQNGTLKAFKVGDMWRIRKDDLIAYTMGKQDNTEQKGNGK